VSKTIRSEFRSSLTSELDFRREARVQEVFARDARRDKITFFSAPAVFPEHSNHEVIVQEFISGMWLHEVLAGIEQRDPLALARMDELNIQPKLLARRLLFMSYWGVFRSLAFHADPHPANIVVRANSEIVFIDFGATGYFNGPRRAIYQRMMDGYRSNNVWEMAKMGIAMSEPLPAVDINEATRDLEKNYYDSILAVRSKNSSWYERTTANAWINNLKIIQKHHVSTPQDLLMFARSSLLYDTLAARLYPRINFYREARRYFDWSESKSRKRGQKRLQEMRELGLMKSIDFQQIERMTKNISSLVFRAERLFSAPYDFAMLPYMVEKWGYVLLNVFKFLGRSIAVTGIGAAGVLIYQWYGNQPLDLMGALRGVITHPVTIGIYALLGILHSRLILFRMGEKTTNS
jgi:predicted unusual protein kinase regulating ubiquinone biosynthesis (AarF/ABC1/UbiB family)